MNQISTPPIVADKNSLEATPDRAHATGHWPLQHSLPVPAQMRHAEIYMYLALVFM